MARPMPAALRRPAGTMPRRPGIVAGLALAVLLAGCAGVPSGGAAVAVRDVPPAAVDDDPNVRLEPRQPAPDDPPDKVVRGFLAAAKSVSERHAIARTFLGPAASTWPDGAGTRIVTVAGLRLSGVSDTASVLVTGREQGRLAADGSYQPGDRQLSVTYHLRRLAVGWRITDPPPGVLLLASDFAQTAKAVDLYFLSPDGQTVVPDRRYLDVPPAVLPTEMATRLLAGPSSWLAPGVRSALPPGTRLRSNVVRDGDVFVVDLSAEVLTAPGPEQVALSAQLVWTLAKRFSVSGIRVLADGRPLRPQRGGLVGRSAYSSYDPRVLTTPVPGYFLDRGSLRTTGAPVVAGPASAAGAGLVSAALSTDLAHLAAVRRRGRGVELVTGPATGPLAARLTAATLTRPSWEAGAAAAYVVAEGRTVLRVPSVGVAAPVPAPGLTAYGPVSSLVLSRDGVRVGVAAGGHLLVGVLGRPGGVLTLTGLREVAVLTDVVDLAWTAEDELLVLGRLGGPRIAWAVDVDGATMTGLPMTGLPADRRHLAAAPGEPDLIEAGGRIWRRSGAGWAPATRPAVSGGAPAAAPVGTSPFYPG